ncbi:MAG: NAD(P)-dependent oxidoreductase [Gemmobacter sp.]
MSARPIGIVGLGIMGLAYARNLRKAGFEVAGTDPSAPAMAALGDAGGAALPDAAAVARACEVILLALPSAAALHAVTGAMLPVLGPGHILAEMGTLPIAEKEAARARIAPSGALLTDCPVSGTGAQAARGDLVVFMSGPEAATARLRPVFAGLARDVRHIGPFGHGMKLKIVANLLVTVHNLAAAEALLLAERSGLDLGAILDALTAGAGSSRMLEVRGPLMVAGSYTPATMKMDVYQKDLDVILGHAAAVRTPVPLMSASVPYYSAALAQGRDKEDTAALFAVLRQLAGMSDADA